MLVLLAGCAGTPAAPTRVAPPPGAKNPPNPSAAPAEPVAKPPTPKLRREIPAKSSDTPATPGESSAPVSEAGAAAVSEVPIEEEPAPASPEPLPEATADAPSLAKGLASLRAAADAEGATVAARKALVGALISEASGPSLVEAEGRLDQLKALAGVSRLWVALMRAAIAEAGGEPIELESSAREAWIASLRELPLEAGGAYVTNGELDGKGRFERRESISFRPDDYVSVSFEIRHQGFTDGEDAAGRFGFSFHVEARLLDEKGERVQDFSPPDHTYRGTLAHPGNLWTRFEFLLNRRLPLDLAAGNYRVELTLTDRQGKERLGGQTVTIDIRVR